METPSSQSSFLSGPILSPLIRFALPLMLSLLLQAFYGGVDLAVVGKFSPTASVSAVATGSQVMQSITSIITGLTMGVTVLVGKAMGSRESQQAGQVVCSQIRLFTLVAAVLTGAMLLLAPQAARLMNVPEAAMSEAVAYIRICSAGIVFITAYNGISGIFRGVGNSRSPFLFVLIACLVNVVLDVLFVGVFRLNAAGAAPVFGDQPFDPVLRDGSLVHCPGKGPLHGDDLPGRDTGGGAGVQPFMGGQDAGVQPPRPKAGKGGQLLGAGGQQDVALCAGQQGRSPGGVGGGQGAGGQRAARAQQPQILHPGRPAGRLDVPAGLHGVGVGGVDAEGRPGGEGGHLLRLQPAGAQGDAGGRALGLGPIGGGHADRHRRPLGRKGMGEPPALARPAEDQDHRPPPSARPVR